MWPFLLARKQLFPPGRFPVFAFVSILGVAFGVAALLVVQTVMNSFGEEHRRRIRESAGDIIITVPPSNPLGPAAEISDLLEREEGVKAAAPYIEGAAVLLDEDRVGFYFVRGIDTARERRVTPLDQFLPAEVLNGFDDEHVILGSLLAQKLGVGIGERITLSSSAHVLQAVEGNRRTLPKELEVHGIFHTGFVEIDGRAMFTTLETARDMFALPKNCASSIHLKLHDHRRADEIAARLNAKLMLPPARAKAWTDVRKEFLQAVEMEKQMLFFLMFIITLVASFSIGSTLFSHVVRRTREIGLISALGGTPARILIVFLVQGVLVGALGYGIGTTFAILTLHFRQNIVALLGAQDVMNKQYLFEKVPLHYNPADFFAAALLTLGLITAVSLLPAIWAARRKPSEAMRDAS
ncbi:MAG: ABC transporter permease [Puniceicoccales bacterium]|jgi:lipoprotein-releasing system permease protein|nr:ABC transporter permease [Puniceicoccales bacterium]